MEPRRPPEYHLEIAADRQSIRDVVKGILHTIFFHRYFTPLIPSTHEILDQTLPYVSSEEVESLILKQTQLLLRHLDAASSSSGAQTSPTSRPRGQLVVQFLEKKRRKGWFVAKADEETVWENWVIDVTLTTARSEPEAVRNRRLMERGLEKAAMKIVGIVNRERGHIPPITTNESNPFPYNILVNPKEGGWGKGMGIF
ncbi:hypothetical protein CLAFUW4_07142 [Fulvia fulva]|uniref:Autophagy-related protein 101 n=1 Tax=Passalora fulva TaxID=5499 RepID=A0A9Q8PA29_PASFU|nr:uncharacterized protein CLAFUR5_07276 [Fulvia fulva]KAK4622314.1 hypothetical protein CLAFUR4_07151 [Fulvia fulva]KAK4623375.1 hypothetical protein CLAFUR0_07149 [Fulvia fulva]UJO18662.1 hypothetical protein CLAFUR5_07276 [Fulvia fulva]WPV16290.1 hypothetical protein CLAFUW4_07142 [Fulvia fulva]WPV30990.1 hypothetical protein CLAFUW7_07143 [Fulvia fulva]